MDLPVVFFHDGDQEYLRLAISSAGKYNDKVVLLGTKSNKGFSKIWYDVDTFDMERFRRFEKSYVHMSSNSTKFELTAIKKYYVLLEYMINYGIQHCVLIDSDILVNVDFTKLRFLEDYCASVSKPIEQSKYEWVASGHTFYCTIEALESFIHFFEDCYRNHIEILKEKYNWHIQNGVKGGICDMTLLYLWSKSRRDIFNWLECEDYIIDHSLQTADHNRKKQFLMNKILRIKKIKYVDDIPYFYDIQKKKWVRALTLHFQGSAKSLMKGYFNRESSVSLIKSRYSEYLLRALKIKNKNKT